MKPHRVTLASAALAALLAAAPVAAQAPAPITDEQLRQSFNAADTNRDGHIDIDEAVADSILVFARFDVNRDGFLVMTELPRHNPERFRRADRDGDGKLSVGEVAADRVYEFFLVDTSRNGVLSYDEVRAYSANLRAAK